MPMASGLPLKNPVKDAKEIKAILERRYYVDESIELYDAEATKAGILKLFERLSNELQPEDSPFHLLCRARASGYDELDGAFLDPLQRRGRQVRTEELDPQRSGPQYPLQVEGQARRPSPRTPASRATFSTRAAARAPKSAPSITGTPSAGSRAKSLSSGADETVPDASQFAAQLKLALEGNTKPLYRSPRAVLADQARRHGEPAPLRRTQEFGAARGGQLPLFPEGRSSAFRGRGPERSACPRGEARAVYAPRLR